ncbi:glutathione S-transferase [Loktanella sp. 5RATIMAR09]|uniref:glutathione S-transferase family protein n=1 Tax=Loktanella sp. 5RATIMAR09 TaxID=1225655 RepID=UPI0006EB3540|nr:glutathione S-transferase family protein [Loktanella sp. 5RATIMAR09]KQI72810.1 glutathione S-transferase [Loktanella sp. 5RATIMAR09]
MIRLHHCPQTRSMRSLWLLHELGVEFDVVTYPFDKTLRQEPYRSLNPTGRVPTLEIDDVVLTESGAIAEYLCERFPQAGLGRDPSHAERAPWLNWIHFAETISQHTAALTQQHIALYDDTMRSPIIMQLEAKRLRKTLETVDLSLTGDYLLSDFSAADIGVGQAVYMAKHFVHLDDLPALARWYARLQARPAFQKSLPDGLGLYAKAFYPPWEA